MQGHAPTNRINMLICGQRCSDAFRELAAQHNWVLLEGIEPDPALHACVAIEPSRVCLEIVNAPRFVPDIVRRLAALDSIGHVGCLIPEITKGQDASLIGLGVAALTSVDEAEEWLCSMERVGAPTHADNRIRSPRFPVKQRARVRERSVHPCD